MKMKYKKQKIKLEMYNPVNRKIRAFLIYLGIFKIFIILE
jgi:hypothetical protein